MCIKGSCGALAGEDGKVRRGWGQERRLAKSTEDHVFIQRMGAAVNEAGMWGHSNDRPGAAGVVILGRDDSVTRYQASGAASWITRSTLGYISVFPFHWITATDVREAGLSDRMTKCI